MKNLIETIKRFFKQTDSDQDRLTNDLINSLGRISKDGNNYYGEIGALKGTYTLLASHFYDLSKTVIVIKSKFSNEKDISNFVSGYKIYKHMKKKYEAQLKIETEKFIKDIQTKL